MTPPLPTGREEREADCPRCHQTCGWCGDYRHMHGKLKLPGSRKYCSVSGMEPEGDHCPLCHGSKRVVATTTYRPARGDHLQKDQDNG